MVQSHAEERDVFLTEYIHLLAAEAVASRPQMDMEAQDHKTKYLIAEHAADPLLGQALIELNIAEEQKRWQAQHKGTKEGIQHGK